MAVRAAKVQRLCAMNFPYRQLAPFGALRAWAAERGPVRFLEATVRNAFLGADVTESGDLGGLSHLVDAALWLSGEHEPTVVTATFSMHDGCSTTVNLETEAGIIRLNHRPSAEPGIHGHWSLGGQRWEAGLYAGYSPARNGWSISAPRAYVNGEWQDLGPEASPRADTLEPWALAHVATARAFLAAISGANHSTLAGFEQGARVQRVLEAMRRSIGNRPASDRS